MQNTTNNNIMLKMTDIHKSFGSNDVLKGIDFTLDEGKVLVIIGSSGSGKTTLLRDIVKNENPAIRISEDANIAFLSQIHEEMLDEDKTVYEEFETLGFETKAKIREYLVDYCFPEESLDSKIAVLSGGEKNLLQLAKIALGSANLLILDEPTSHLDMYAQIALEKAIAEYKGAILMVSHDFYSIANGMDYVLYVEEKTVRRMRIRAFRKMIYENHFDKDYLELEQKKKELEMRMESALKVSDIKTAKSLCEQLGEIVEKMVIA